MTRNGAGELAVTDAQWAADRYGLSLGNGPRFEMYVYVEDLDATLTRLVEASVEVCARPRTCRGGSESRRSQTPEGNPVALCREK